MIIAITGYPKSGKSVLGAVLAKRKDMELISTDSFINKYGFLESPTAIINELADKKDYIIEGVTVARMLKHGHIQKTWAPDRTMWVVGGERSNPISKSTFNAFQTWVSDAKKSHEFIWDIKEYLGV
jgi:hypothetical protein